MALERVPDHLVESIIRGRCIAFVGAGFSAPVVPLWGSFLKDVAKEMGCEYQLGGWSALDYEAMGQHLQDFRPDWTSIVAKVIAGYQTQPNEAGGVERLDRRRKHLLRIPFKAILTTNFDESLAGDFVSPDQAWQVLRDSQRRWWQLPDGSTPIINLHGIAGRQHDPRLVLSRSAYRELLYDDGNYANFIRSVFAEYTILFIGVSFTDAYLNELRSEVLNLLHKRSRSEPWGYAILCKPPEFAQFLRHHEGIELLQDAPDFSRFDGWIESIAERTSVEGRLRELLHVPSGEPRHIVWVDEDHRRNVHGHGFLGVCGARITALESETEITEEHRGADLIITQYGTANSRALNVLERVRRWDTRPPVIIFAGGYDVQARRHDCLRRGAWEYTTQWSELYRSIEVLFGRSPGM